ncbi:alpha/beta hydrolase-fold protein [Streptomyces sp. VNUA116]|uniref:alpha/beta hydrolase n=1 Tax=Streptomyces sp. VNUA116 TaxID=3062449 RepID=UPI002675328F|nr:alpha/beta hydrolase-fold protein [Streptomyces sp. VNUA116]WKU48558.1 alpha/beta hydrolase-fold protein [Streptomyces sp. VNUA116]
MQISAGPLDWSLVSGWIPVALLAVGLCALVALLFSRRRTWWTRWAPAAVLLAAAATWLLRTAVDDWWQPFPDPLPTGVVVWAGIAVLGVCLAAFRIPLLRPRHWAGAVLAGLLVVLLGASEINRHFDQYPTARSALNSWLTKTTSITEATGSTEPVLRVPAGKTVADVWRPPAGMAEHGTLSKSSVPGVRSGFHARSAYIYLPPAYRATPRPLLPVVVLMAGQPGSPDDWINSGRLVDMMNAFAGEHRGLAPVVVVVDPLGSQFANTLCLDSRLGNVQTYLATDVPDWIRSHLQVAPARTSWVISGISFGGTCSIQLGVNAPQVYGVVNDISGQEAPTLGSRQKTVDKAFGGDTAAFTAVNPLDVMARQRFPGTKAAFVAGSSDSTYGPQQRKVYDAAVKAGMRAEWVLLPGGHSWQVWRPGLEKQLPWISRETGLTR